MRDTLLHCANVSSWSLDPLLVWGLFTRGVGLVLFISFLSLSTEVVSLAGSQARVGSIKRRLDKIREDFPTWKRFVYFPTLLWLTRSDGMLRVLSLTGLVSAGLVVYGGPYSDWALLVCYVCFLSLDMAMGLMFPWDCLLFETTFLALFLPPTNALPELTAAVAPAPALAWAFRLLLFRLMFGFGKQKFLGARQKDTAYLRGFLIYQPLLSPIGWLAHKLPLGVLRIGILFMFLVEIPAPFFVFFPGVLSVICAGMTAALMIGIQLTGNFGYFSLATIMLCIPLLDNVTPLQLSLGGLFAPGSEWITNAFVLVHTLAAMVVFPMNSWISQSWIQWAVWYRLPHFFQPMFKFFRALQPFRWLHPYGVFPPNNQPGVKVSVVPEVSWDGKSWHELYFKYSPTNERSKPHFIAPHHPRGDQSLIYHTFGMNANSLVSSMIGTWDPYYYASAAAGTEFCQKLCEGATQLAHTPEAANHAGPPRAARISTVMLEPTTIRELKQTGRWWTRTYIGPHSPTHEYDPDFWTDAYGEPEEWHPEAIMWRQRSRFNELMERARAGKDDPLQLAIWDQKLRAADVELFWNEFVPLVTRTDRTTFDTLPDIDAELRTRFSREQRRALGRLLGRFTLILVARLETHYFYLGFGKAKLHAESYLHLWMLAHHIIAQGKGAYLHALAHDEVWNEELAKMTHASGLYLHCVFHFDHMCFEAQKMRLINSFIHPHDLEAKRVVTERLKTTNLDALPPSDRLIMKLGRGLSGFFCVMTDIRDNFKGPRFQKGFPELYPTFEELESGDIRIRSYAYPKPDEPMVPDLKDVKLPPNAASA